MFKANAKDSNGQTAFDWAKTKRAGDDASDDAKRKEVMKILRDVSFKNIFIQNEEEIKSIKIM